MEPKLELVTINGKEYQLDIEQAKKLNLLKEKDNRVRSWKEFNTKYKSNIAYGFVDLLGLEKFPGKISFTRNQLTPHEAQAIAAFSKLLKLRRDWVGEWEPDWKNHQTQHYVLEYLDDRIRIYPQWYYARSFSFPTAQMAKEFLKTFHDLIEEAKILI